MREEKGVNDRVNHSEGKWALPSLLTIFYYISPRRLFVATVYSFSTLPYLAKLIDIRPQAY